MWSTRYVGHVVHDDAADLERLEGAPGVRQVVREDARLEAEATVVDLGQRVLEVAEREGDDERREGLLRAHLRALRGGVDDDRGREPAAPSAWPPTRTRAPSASASRTQRSVRAAASGSTIGPRSVVGVHGVAHPQRRGARDEALHERVPDRLVDEQPLHADADLAGCR